MPTLEERVAYLEGKVEDHTAIILDVRASVRELREEMIRRFEQVDRRLETGERRFLWMVGTQMAVLVATIGSVVGSLYR
jgi:hypothetical protein